MVVNGFELPVAFVQLCAAIKRGEAPDEWRLKENVDAYGKPWSVSDLRLFCAAEDLQEETDWISRTFLQEGRYTQPSTYRDADEPGFITDFMGVASFVQFADSTDGKPYAFDFGANSSEPSVVYYQGYWRRVAPSFETFINLFVNVDEAPPSELDHDNWEPAPSDPRTLLTYRVPQYVRASDADDRPFLGELVGAYAKLSPIDRREVEVETREELNRRGLTDEQRELLDELWERLRAS